MNVLATWAGTEWLLGTIWSRTGRFGHKLRVTGISRPLTAPLLYTTGRMPLWPDLTRSRNSSSTTGRPDNHLAILARPNAPPQLFYYRKSLTVSILFFTAALKSILVVFDQWPTQVSHIVPGIMWKVQHVPPLHNSPWNAFPRNASSSQRLCLATQAQHDTPHRIASTGENHQNRKAAA